MQASDVHSSLKRDLGSHRERSDKSIALYADCAEDTTETCSSGCTVICYVAQVASNLYSLCFSLPSDGETGLDQHGHPQD